MARKTVDCRAIPNEVGCTLTMSGEEEELLEAAVIHAVTRHEDRVGLSRPPTGSARQRRASTHPGLRSRLQGETLDPLQL